MAVFTVSRAWKPTNGKSYGTVEVRMAPDFQRADPQLWGLVEARDLTNTTSFDLLRIVGDRSWSPRFDAVNYGPNATPWQTALGGSNGAQTALAGLMAADCKRLNVKRLEVAGVPGPGVHYQRTGLGLGSALFDRTGWPVYGDLDSKGGSSLRGITSRDHWWGSAWGESGVTSVTMSLRALAPRCAARGELVVNEAGYELLDYTQQGDGVAWKCAGTQFRIAGFQGGPCWLGGTVAANLTAYPDPVRYRHLHESRGITVEDSYLANCSAPIQDRALLYASSPFTEVPVFRRVTFRRTHQLFAVQQNTGAHLRYEDCTFIGWNSATAAIELDQRPGFESQAFVDGCRFYPS